MDFCVYVNTAQEFDGSDSGARPDEAISWGKIKKTASPVKVSSDNVIVVYFVWQQKLDYIQNTSS